MLFTNTIHTLLEAIPLILGVIVILLIAKTGKSFERDRGWKLIVAGLTLFLFGRSIDLVEDLLPFFYDKAIFKTFLENILGDALAFILTGLGLSIWLPKLIANERAKKELEKSHRSLVEKLDKNVLEINEFKKKLIDQVSHDLKTPLSGIIGCMEIILGMDIPDEQKKYIKEVNRSSDDILNVIEKMKHIENLNPVQMIKSHFLIRESLQNIYSTLEEKNIKNDKTVFMNIESTVPQKVFGPKLYFEAFFTNFIECLFKLEECNEIIINIYSGINDNYKTYINIQVALNGENCKIDLENPSEKAAQIISVLKTINGKLSVEDLTNDGTSVYNVAIPFSLVE